MKSSWLFAIVCCLSATIYAAHSSNLSDEASPPRFKLADGAYRERGNEARAREALTLYRKAYAEAPNDGDAAWRVAMGCHLVGLRHEKNEAAKEALFREGEAAGNRALELKGESCAPCHFWTAINRVLLGDSVGPFKMLFALKPARKHLEEVVKIDPAYAYGGAYRILGLMEQKLPGVLGGSDRKAEGFFEKAIEVAPDDPMNYMMLAKLLKENLHDMDKAREVAKKGLALPIPSADRVEAVESVGELKDLLQTLDSKS